jgi:hypothetical protein
MAFRCKYDSNRIIFCVPQSTDDNTQVQIVDCVGAYEAIIPAGQDCVVISIVKNPCLENKGIENFEYID